MEETSFNTNQLEGFAMGSLPLILLVLSLYLYIYAYFPEWRSQEFKVGGVPTNYNLKFCFNKKWQQDTNYEG